ncbi:MAG: GspE/PulE family protein [Acidiferrobacterales bacterium]
MNVNPLAMLSARRTALERPQSRTRLGDMLIEMKLVTAAQLRKALDAQRSDPTRKLGAILVEQKALTEPDLARVLTSQRDPMNGQGGNHSGSNEGTALPDLPATVRDIAVRDGRILYVATGRAGHPLIQSWLHDAKRQGCEITVEQTDLSSVANMRAIISAGVSSTKDLSAIRQFRRLLADAVAHGASDIHLTLTKPDSGGSYLDVQYRIKGDVVLRPQIPGAEGELIVGAVFQGMASVADATVQEQEDQNGIITNHAFLTGDDGKDLGLAGVRLAKSKLVHGIGVAARLLFHYKDNGQDLLDQLGYSPRQNSILRRLVQATIGVNLFTGPTGSGKSTTLAAEIRNILRQRPGVRIITIEDPVEHEFGDPRVWQYHIANANSDEDKSRAFAGKLKAALREDPDIIMVGEVRGLETAREAINAAITGHQVWTTLHVSDPFMTPQRLIAMGLDGFFLTDPKLLSSLVAQRLVKTLCPHCARTLSGHEDQLDPVLLKHLSTWTDKSPFPDLSRVRIRGPGCAHCNHSGVRGRTVVAQVVPTDEKLLEDLVQHGSAYGRNAYMNRPDAEIDMMAHGVLKVLAGEIDPRAVGEALEPLIARPETLRPLTMEDV